MRLLIKILLIFLKEKALIVKLILERKVHQLDKQMLYMLFITASEVS